MRLVFVHGRAQGGKDSDVLQVAWEAALSRGLRKSGLSWPTGVDVDFPCYADELDRLVRIMNQPLITHILERGETAVPAENFRARLLQEFADGYGIRPEEIHAKFEGPAVERAPQNWRWVRALARALDRSPLGEDAIDRLTRDVYVYLSARGTRLAIDSIVDRVLTSGPCVVVAHSLGSVVGYDVLCETKKGADVKMFVTVGSPLGLQGIKDQLDSTLRNPPGVAHWFNARDPRDIVALYPLDAPHFGITPAIQNKSDVDNFTDNRHGIEGYLEDPEVAATIYAGLTT
jgi:hypothetical protein